ncbi:CHRD domain-containing protein [Chitinophaga filiformis]|uniref:CHRD domain-containing protein n=1 Tax=Chitinophaga filiformis TaxID=104663 RepID=UPI001F1B2C4B|nr:CHRD domain-containing protein [Chitinophaga filiformis]MCF6405465.1 CHRD domain-containing protein [Chitinophaga filiformis]
MKNKHVFAMTALALAGLTSISSCKDDDDNNNIVLEFEIPLSAKMENPAPEGRAETGLLTMRLRANNTLEYSFDVDNLTSGDALTAAHFHAGDPVTNGPVILPFPSWTGTTSSGTLTLRQSLADSLKNASNDIYFNVHSTQNPGGLVRGPVNTDLVLAETINLSGANEVPPVVTTATGIALLRLTDDRRLYSKVTVTNVPVGDALTMAHIHRGAAGANGDVLVTLCATEADFGMSKLTQLDEANANTVRTEALYVNAHSTMWPAGIIRGQIR